MAKSNSINTTNYPRWFLILFFLLNVLLFLGESSSSLSSWRYEQEELSWLDDKDDEINMVQSRRSSLKRCDFSNGKWVYDQTYPLYDSSCPYLSTAVTCKKNGRPDSDYEKWRWKPHGCDIPRYVRTYLLPIYNYSSCTAHPLWLKFFMLMNYESQLLMTIESNAACVFRNSL